MVKLRTLTQKDVTSLDFPLRYDGKALKNPNIERGFLVEFNGEREPYCEAIIIADKKRYLVDLNTKQINVGDNTIWVPQYPKTINHYKGNFALSWKEEYHFRDILELALMHNILDGNEFVARMQQLRMTEQDITREAEYLYGSQPGIAGAFFGLLLGTSFYFLPESTNFHLRDWVQYNHVAGISVATGGFIESSLPEILKIMNKRRKKKAVKHEFNALSMDLESRITESIL